MNSESVETIDITPTWAEWASIYARFAESGERKACAKLRDDLMRMAALADRAVKTIKSGE